MLAEIAAVFRILSKAFYIKLLRLTDNMADTVLPAKILSLFQLTLGKGTGGGGNGNHLFSKYIMGDLQ